MISIDHNFKRKDDHRKQLAAIENLDRITNTLTLHVSTTGYSSTNSLKNSTDGNTLYSTSTATVERFSSNTLNNIKEDKTKDDLKENEGSVDNNLKQQLYDEVYASFDINSIPVKQEMTQERRNEIQKELQIMEKSKISESQPATVVAASDSLSISASASSLNTVDSSSSAISPPRPSSLPTLSFEQEVSLSQGEKIHMQFRKSRTGNGIAVVDIAASEEEIWSVLRDFRNYPHIIPTIRDVKVNFEYKDVLTKGIFVISKFRFRLGIVHRFTQLSSKLDFTLDDDRSNYGSILELAQGFWYVEKSPNFYLDPKDQVKKQKSRIYLCADVKVNRFVPMWLVEYASERALARATNWIVPHFEKRKGIESDDNDNDIGGGSSVGENDVTNQRILELKRFQ